MTDVGEPECYDEAMQVDVKVQWEHGMEEEMDSLLKGFEVKGKEKLVCRLKKSLYGLKQAPRQWYIKFDSFMAEQGYSRCNLDHYVYFKRLDDDHYIILCLYVDDMLVAGSNMDHIK